jgi:hypothetical protein
MYFSHRIMLKQIKSKFLIYLKKALGNLEKLLFGQGFQARIFPEGIKERFNKLKKNKQLNLNINLVLLALGGAIFASSVIHRVSVTTW